MRISKVFISCLLASFLIGCGETEEKKESNQIKIGGNKTETPKQQPQTSAISAEKTIDLNNKGVGPIKSLTLSETIDQNMVAKGAEVFKYKCTACHKIGSKFIGPAPNGILKRRSPEWVMNMILDPEGMVNNDPLAKQLLLEYNGSPMANQNLTEDEARSILEYFRTLQ
ncbi:cytochrome C [Gilvibacter sp. SZ-19]|jgi:mono/diheme cytochrome c family protein|uniref:c-type cytochrome n=1 Tax=unclassified Gilvibacter TaxID=2625242 RepID=UPI000B3C8869|nr:cytochrome c [Gilvibacter sp. SZ-19]ARV12269.1 cytochrome C [Gilvibacter sp. SZ-19]